MLWKSGCLVAILGVLLTFSSCAFFGRAIQTAIDANEVANLPIEPGVETVHSVRVDPSRRAQIRIEATVRLPESVRENGRSILQLAMPVNYRVFRGEDGDRIHAGAGELSGSVILPAGDGPSADDFDPDVTLTYSSESFDPLGAPGEPESGRRGSKNAREIPLSVRTEIGAADEEGNPVVAARLFVIERPREGATGWTWGGIASFVLGPGVAFIGLVLFLVGLFTRSRSARPAPPVVRPD